jgi:type VI secretion system secreted protein Hcp
LESRWPQTFFAKLGDIKGESPDDKYKDEIEVLSFSWGVTSLNAPGAPGRRGQANVPRPVDHSQHRQGVSSAAQACATGLHLKEATITHRAGKGQQEYRSSR